jgi:hypothetical protein
MDNQKQNARSQVYDKLPIEFKQILDSACHAAYKAGYSEGYEDGKSGAEDHSQTEEQAGPHNAHNKKKWKGRESESWKWV